MFRQVYSIIPSIKNTHVLPLQSCPPRSDTLLPRNCKEILLEVDSRVLLVGGGYLQKMFDRIPLSTFDGSQVRLSIE